MLALFRLLSRLPLGLLQAAGAAFGVLVYLCSPSYRAKLDANLAQAGLARSLRWSCARHAGRMIAELPFVWFRPLRAIVARVRTEGLPVLEATAREGGGVLYLTPHLGTFEVCARYLSERGPITVMFKPPKQAPIERLMAAARNAGAMKAVPANLSGVRAMLRALRRGEAVGLLPDQVPGVGEGQWAPFFGRPAYTLTLPLRLAQASAATVVLLACERLAAGRGWRLHVERFEGVPTPEALNAAMERLVMRSPAQYLWGYNRYKQPRDGPGAPAAGAGEGGRDGG